MPLIEQQGKFSDGGTTIMAALLAWERMPSLLKPWVRTFEVEDWAADGWRGWLELRDHCDVCTSLVLSRQQGQARFRVGDLAQAELIWSPATDWAVAESCSEPRQGAPVSNASSFLRRRVAADDPAVLRVVDWALRRMLHVGVLRARLLGRRFDGAGFPADRCQHCFGPLTETSGAGERRCSWAGHESTESGTGLNPTGGCAREKD